VPAKKLGRYVDIAKKNTQFFTTYDPSIIFEDLQKELLSFDGISDQTIKYDAKKWRVDFEIVQRIPTIPMAEELEAEEESKAGEEEIVLGATCTVKLLHVEGEKLAVEFSKSGGSQQLFYQAYLQLCEKLQDLNNVA